jgi:molybdenum cofactor guanylyltransferase
MRIAGCILAGGKSSRMGSDKASVLLGGKTLLQRAVDRLSPQVDILAINTNNRSLVSAYPIVPDSDDVISGPLAGVLAVLQWAKMQAPIIEAVVTVSVDTPFVPTNLVKQLRTPPQRIVNVAMHNGQIHPTCALWPLDIEPVLHEWVSDPFNRSARRFLSTIQHNTVEFFARETYDTFMNINTPLDLADAEQLLQKL